jgi:cell division protein FtsI (penicillin-binding protein 3)
MLYNAVANNGKMMKPYLISAVREYGKDVKVFKPVVLEEAIAKPEAIKQLQACTREVAISGTGKHIASPFYNISGKTGTAQVADKGIAYSAGVYQGSFVGYFPSERPRYTVAVVIRTKAHSSAYYGGTLAAPVFRMVADKIFANGMGMWNGPLDSLARKSNTNLVTRHAATGSAYAALFKALGKPLSTPSKSTLARLTFDSSQHGQVVEEKIYYGTVPDVKGLGLKDAVYLLENEGMKVQVVGRGLIQGQSVAPGTKVIKGQKIVLLLS